MEGSGVLLLVLLAGFMYVVVVLPRRRQMARQQQLQASLAMGSRVVTIGGIKGVVVGLGETSVDVEVAPGIPVTFVREAIANVEPVAALNPDDPASGDQGSDERGDSGELGEPGGESAS
jgi:preprotein translocase subunit YajC